MVLGHLQRGGGPTTADRLLALRFGAAAARCLVEDCGSGMVALRANRIELVPLEEVAGKTKTVPLDSDTVVTAREMGLCFGDEGARPLRRALIGERAAPPRSSPSRQGPCGLCGIAPGRAISARRAVDRIGRRTAAARP